MARRLASFFVICALLLGPALCMGGLLEHHCACDDACDVESDVESDHDVSCPDDDCATVVRTEDADVSLDFDTPQVVAIAMAWTMEPAPAGLPWLSKPPLPPDRWNLPFAQSDRPQLI